MNTIGEVLKYIRSENNLTIDALSSLSNVSIQSIKDIEDYDKYSYITISDLSIALKVDLLEYTQMFSEFENLEEYNNYVKLRGYIENKDLRNIIETTHCYRYDNLKHLKVTTYIQLVLLTKAIEATSISKDYITALQFCYMALEVKESELNLSLISDYLTNDITYIIFNYIETSYFHLDCIDQSKEISKRLIDAIESKYDFDLVHNMKMPNTIFRVYIYSLNNYADCLFNEQNYVDSLDICYKNYHYIEKHNVNYSIQTTLFLFTENYYNLNMLNDSKKFLILTICSCIALNTIEYAQNFKEIVKSSY